MFLLAPEIFLWDLILLLIISISIAAAIFLAVWSTHATKSFPKSVAKWSSALCSLFATVTVYSACIEPQLLFTTREILSHPFAQPLKIVVISDLHVGPYKGKSYIEKVVQHVNRELPDLVLIPGDFISSPRSNLEDLLPLADLRAPAGIFAVLGNHDEGEYRTLFGKVSKEADRGDEIAEFLQRMGITVLRNENRAVKLQDGDIVIAGVDDYFTGHHSVARALQDVPRSVFSILLSHNPSVITDEDALKAHLIVSGHTHGGQVRLPGIGPLVQLPISIEQRYDQGMFQVDNDSFLAITRGTGESHARVRLFAPPEILVITLQ